MASIDDAQRWRKQFGYVGRGGVIVIFEGKVQGWVNELRNPEDWQPSCIAVDEAGHIWTAIAGDEQNGAMAWMPNDVESWKNTRTVKIN